VQVPDDGRVVLGLAAPAYPDTPGERAQLVGGGLDDIDWGMPRLRPRLSSATRPASL
jgi:hypothetical protein